MTALVEGMCKYNDYSTCLTQIPDTTMFMSVVDAFAIDPHHSQEGPWNSLLALFEAV